MNRDDIRKDIDAHFVDALNDDEKESLTSICENMLNSKPLDGEFAKILNDNLWELLQD